MNYLILSVYWSKGDYCTWYAPDAMGYTRDINSAGRFTKAEADRHESNRTLVVPEGLAIEMSREYRLAEWIGARRWRNHIEKAKRD